MLENQYYPIEDELNGCKPYLKKQIHYTPDHKKGIWDHFQQYISDASCNVVLYHAYLNLSIKLI